MEEYVIAAPPFMELERCYLMQATLKHFKGREHVVAHLYRHGDPADATDAAARQEELRNLRATAGLVAEANDTTPPGASADAALLSVLEAFTAEEGNQVLEFLRQRYAGQLEKVFVFPLELPLPLGLTPFSQLPEEGPMGFIRFDAMRDYTLPFKVRGFYDLSAPPPTD